MQTIGSEEGWKAEKQTDRDREIERVREGGREMQTIGSEEGRKAEKQRTDRQTETER